MPRKARLPFALKPLPKRAALGAIEGEHTEHQVSRGLFRTILRTRRAEGVCFPDAELFADRVATRHLDACKHRRSAGRLCSPATLRELAHLRETMLAEVGTLRRKGVKGRIPICIQPVTHAPHAPKWFGKTVRTHERFHARTARARARLNPSNVYRKTEWAALNEPSWCETEGIDYLIGKHVPAGEAGGVRGRWGVSEEAMARVAELHHACHVEKDKILCDGRTDMLTRELTGVTKNPRVLRTIADTFAKAGTSPDKFMEKLVACGKPTKVGAQKPKRTKAKAPAKTRKTAPTKAPTPRVKAAKAKTKKKSRCYKAPKKPTNRCTEDAYRANIRHYICKGKKPQRQAVGIATGKLYKTCKVKPPKKGKPKKTIKQIVAAGKRNRRRK